MQLHGITFPEAKLDAFCKKHRISRLSLFGSILTDDFRPESDVDMLVEFHPDARVSLIDLGGMLMELQSMIGRPVDLRTPQDLSKYFRSTVQNEARLLYAA